MSEYIVYSPTTGRVFSKISCPPSLIEQNSVDRGYSYLESDSDLRKVWVDLSDTSIQAKVDNPATLSGTTLSNLPLPCTVTMRGPASAEAYVEQDGLTLEADVPCRYRVTVVADHPKYYDAEFEVDL